MTANVNKCAVLVCIEDKKKPVEFKWKWRGAELPIVDQDTYLGVEISKNCSWDAHNSILVKWRIDFKKEDQYRQSNPTIGVG